MAKKAKYKTNLDLYYKLENAWQDVVFDERMKQIAKHYNALAVKQGPIPTWITPPRASTLQDLEKLLIEGKLP